MRHRLARVRGNLVLRDADSGAHAVYRLGTDAGADALAAALEVASGAEFSLHWVTQQWSFDRYAIATEAAADVRHVHRMALAAYLAAQRSALQARGSAVVPELYLSLRLPGALTSEELDEAEHHMRARLVPSIGCELAAEEDLRWLAQRAWTIGLPSAPSRQPPGRCSLAVRKRSLRASSELGTSHQAFLCLGPAPAQAHDPGAPIGELLGSMNAVGCPIDVALSPARVVRATNGRATSLSTTLSVRVAASSVAKLEQHVERLRAALAPTPVRRPVAQRELFFAHLPGQASAVSFPLQALTPDQLGRMLPRVPSSLGGEAGPYIGRRADGPPRAVRFGASEVSRSHSPCVLIAGAAGTGKSFLMQLIMHQAFLTGSAVCDIDLGADHALHRLDGVHEHARVVELSGDPSLRGFLDPLRIAPPALREELAAAVILRLAPPPPPPEWPDAVRAAVRAVAARGGRLGEVIDELGHGSAVGPEVAAAVAEPASSGPALLAVGTSATTPPDLLVPQLAVLRIAGLPPGPAVSPDARAASARLRCVLGGLLLLYAARLAGRDPTRHVVLGLDRASGLLTDVAGRKLVRHVAKVARARRATAVLATRTLDGVDRLAPLVAAAFCLRPCSEAEARKSLRALGLDADDPTLRQAMRSFETGRCLMRDHVGRTGQVQIEVPDPELAAALGSADGTRRKGGAPTSWVNQAST